jgi:hypothetical protein
VGYVRRMTRIDDPRPVPEPYPPPDEGTPPMPPPDEGTLPAPDPVPEPASPPDEE